MGPNPKAQLPASTADMIPQPAIQPSERWDFDFIGRPKFDEVVVTGHFDYPVEQIFNSLDLTPAQLQSLSGKRALSVGEGCSKLFDALLRLGIDAVAADTWYGQDDIPDTELGRKMRQFVEAHRERLHVSRDSLLPFADNTFETTVSHMLFNNLDSGEIAKVLSECFRVTKLGGDSRHFPIFAESIPEITDLCRARFGDSAQITFQAIDGHNIGSKNNPHLLILQKLGSSSMSGATPS